MAKFKVGDILVHNNDKHLGSQEKGRYGILLEITNVTDEYYSWKDLHSDMTYDKQIIYTLDKEWISVKYMQSPLWKKLEGNNG